MPLPSSSLLPSSSTLPGVTAGATNVVPTGIASAEAFGSQTVTRGALTVTTTGIASGEAFGTTVIARGAVGVTPTGIASAGAFGTPVVSSAGPVFVKNLGSYGHNDITATPNPALVGASSVAVGNYVIVFGWTQQPVTDVTDASGNTYNIRSPGGSGSIFLADSKITTLLNGNISVNRGGSPPGDGGAVTLVAAEFSGLASTAWFEALAATTFSATTAAAGGSRSNASPNGLVLGLFQIDNTQTIQIATPGTGFTNMTGLVGVPAESGSTSAVDWEYKIGTVPNPVTAAATLSAAATGKGVTAVYRDVPPPIVPTFVRQVASFQAGAVGGTSANFDVDVAAATTVGDKIIVYGKQGAGASAVTSVTDDRGNVYTVHADGTGHAGGFVASAPCTTALQIGDKIHIFRTTTGAAYVLVSEWRDVGAYVGASNASFTSTAMVGGSIAPSVNGSLMIGMFWAQTAAATNNHCEIATPGSGYTDMVGLFRNADSTNVFVGVSLDHEYKIMPTTASATADATGSTTPNSGLGLSIVFSPALAAATQGLSPIGIPSAEAFGTTAVGAGAVNVASTGIATAQAVGTPVLSGFATFVVGNITSEEAFGGTVVGGGAIGVTLTTGIASAQAMGAAVVTRLAKTISPSVSIDTAEAFGVVTVAPQFVAIAILPPLLPQGAKWEFWLCSAGSLTRIAPLQRARGKQINLVLNQPGNASFSLPMTDEYADLIQPFTTGILAYRDGSTGKKLVWSGYVATIDEDITNNTMAINCVGWLERLFRRMLRVALTYATTDDGDIVLDLLAKANLTTYGGYTVPIISGATTPTLLVAGSKLPNEGTGGATAYTTASRNKTYDLYTVIGPEIQGLNALENGCDLSVHPGTRVLDIYRKRMRNLPNVTFAFNWGPNNIGQLGRQIDGTTMVNYLLALGTAATVPQFAHDTAAQAVYGLIEESTSLSDVNQTNILQTFAGGEVAIRAQPRQIFSLTPLPWIADSRVPEPFVEYDLGDKVYFTAKWGSRVNILNQAVRVFGISMSIDEEGNERPLPLQLSPA